MPDSYPNGSLDFIFMSNFGRLVDKYLTKMEVFGKKNGSIHFILDIYTYRVSLFTHVQFRASGGQIFDQNGTFWKKNWLNSFHT